MQSDIFISFGVKYVFGPSIYIVDVGFNSM